MTRSPQITIVLGVGDPFSYLALRPAIEFAAKRQVTTDWLPLETPALQPPSEPHPDDDRGIRHRRNRAHALQREIALYAEQQGISIADPYRCDSIDGAYLAWLWVRKEQPDRLASFLVQLFDGYWNGTIDGSDLGSVSNCLAAFGTDAAAFRKWANPDRLADATAELREAGIFQTPAYLIEDEVFYGRQHLPIIDWILDGRSGPVPI